MRIRSCRSVFPGTDPETSDRFTQEIAADENEFVSGLRKLRADEAVSLEAVGFLLGINPGQLSRYLKGNSSTTLTNYLRIARAMGYRTRIVFEKVDNASEADPLADLKILTNRVPRPRVAKAAESQSTGS